MQLFSYVRDLIKTEIQDTLTIVAEIYHFKKETYEDNAINHKKRQDQKISMSHSRSFKEWFYYAEQYDSLNS